MSDHSAAYVGTAFVAGVCLAFAYQELSRPRHEDNVTEQVSPTSGLIARPGPPSIVEGIEGCIGNTPLFRIKSLSDETGCEILGKAEVCRLGTSYTTSKRASNALTMPAVFKWRWTKFKRPSCSKHD